MPGDILFQPLMFRNLTVKNRIFRLDPAVSEHHPRDETLDGLLTISRPVFAYPVEDLSDRAVRTGRRSIKLKRPSPVRVLLQALMDTLMVVKSKGCNA